MSVSGTWNLHYSWGCAGSYGSSTITFAAGGTFSTSTGYTGHWSQTNGNIVWRYDQAPNAVYGGVVNGGAIVGNMTNWSQAGCFYALSGTGTAFAAAKAEAPHLDDSGGKKK